MKSACPIVYCINENYSHYVRYSAKSVLRYNPDAEIIIICKNHIPELSDYEQRIFDWEKYDFHRLHSIAARKLDSSTFVKIFLPEILKEYNYCLYLDGDVLCGGKLNELIESRPEFIGGVEDEPNFVAHYSKHIHENLGCKKYINCGVLLMNLENLRKDKLSEKVLEFTPQKYGLKNDRTFFHEQDLINFFYKDRIEIFDRKFNTIGEHFISDFDSGEYDIRLFHFSGDGVKQKLMIIGFCKFEDSNVSIFIKTENYDEDIFKRFRYSHYYLERSEFFVISDSVGENPYSNEIIKSSEFNINSIKSKIRVDSDLIMILNPDKQSDKIVINDIVKKFSENLKNDVVLIFNKESDDLKNEFLFGVRKSLCGIAFRKKIITKFDPNHSIEKQVLLNCLKTGTFDSIFTSGGQQIDTGEIIKMFCPKTYDFIFNSKTIPEKNEINQELVDIFHELPKIQRNVAIGIVTKTFKTSFKV